MQQSARKTVISSQQRNKMAGGSGSGSSFVTVTPQLP
jgi:hypothetical protein